MLAPNVVPFVVRTLIELIVFVAASKTKDPYAVPPSSKVTPLKLQVIPSAEATDGTQRRTNRAGTASRLRNVIRFISAPKRVSLRSPVLTIEHVSYHSIALKTKEFFLVAAPQAGDYTTLGNCFNDYRPAPATLGGTARYEEVANQRLSTPAQLELPPAEYNVLPFEVTRLYF